MRGGVTDRTRSTQHCDLNEAGVRDPCTPPSDAYRQLLHTQRNQHRARMRSRCRQSQALRAEQCLRVRRRLFQLSQGSTRPHQQVPDRDASRLLGSPVGQRSLSPTQRLDMSWAGTLVARTVAVPKRALVLERGLGSRTATGPAVGESHARSDFEGHGSH